MMASSGCFPEPTESCAALYFPVSGSNRHALVRGDVNAVLAVVQQGLSSREHVDFVAQLEKSRIG